MQATSYTTHYDDPLLSSHGSNCASSTADEDEIMLYLQGRDAALSPQDVQALDGYFDGQPELLQVIEELDSAQDYPITGSLPPRHPLNSNLRVGRCLGDGVNMKMMDTPSNLDQENAECYYQHIFDPRTPTGQNGVSPSSVLVTPSSTPITLTPPKAALLPSVPARREGRPTKKLSAREKNTRRERARRNAFRDCIDACASYLPTGLAGPVLRKKDILNGCALLLQDCKRLRSRVHRSACLVSSAKKQKQCVDECINMLYYREQQETPLDDSISLGDISLADPLDC